MLHLVQLLDFLFEQLGRVSVKDMTEIMSKVLSCLTLGQCTKEQPLLWEAKQSANHHNFLKANPKSKHPFCCVSTLEKQEQ